MADDCGGHTMASGNCSCERATCHDCGTSYHYDDDTIRRCDTIGWVCTDCDNYRCSSECCMPAECFDGRDR